MSTSTSTRRESTSPPAPGAAALWVDIAGQIGATCPHDGADAPQRETDARGPIFVCESCGRRYDHTGRPLCPPRVIGGPDDTLVRRFDGFRTPTGPAHESPAGLAAHRRTWGERTAHGLGSLAVAVDVGLVLCLIETGHAAAAWIFGSVSALDWITHSARGLIWSNRPRS